MHESVNHGAIIVVLSLSLCLSICLSIATECGAFYSYLWLSWVKTPWFTIYGSLEYQIGYLSLKIYSYLWLSMKMCSCPWLSSCGNIYDSLSVALYGSLSMATYQWLYVAICGYIWLYMATGIYYVVINGS